MGKNGLSILVENDAGSTFGEYGSVIVIGAVDDVAGEAPGPGAGVVPPPHAAIDDTIDEANPITTSLVSAFTHSIVRALTE